MLIVADVCMCFTLLTDKTMKRARTKLDEASMSLDQIGVLMSCGASNNNAQDDALSEDDDSDDDEDSQSL